jgi:phage baseplate assembly protein W
MVTRNREYKDLDLNFTAHPVSGDIAKVEDEDAVKRSIRNLILTNHYERPFQPDLGSNVLHTLFEPMNRITQYRLRTEIEDLINFREPRADLLQVKVESNYDDNRYEVTIVFMVQDQMEPLQLQIFLQRVR